MKSKNDKNENFVWFVLGIGVVWFGAVHNNPSLGKPASVKLRILIDTALCLHHSLITSGVARLNGKGASALVALEELCMSW